MTIRSVLEELKSSSRPVVKTLHKTTLSKVLCIGLSKGMELKEHKAHQPTRLIVVEGCIEYKESGRIHIFSKFDEHQIPVEVTHAVDALEESVILLLQG